MMTADLWTKPTDLNWRPGTRNGRACIVDTTFMQDPASKPYPPSPFIIITQPES